MSDISISGSSSSSGSSFWPIFDEPFDSLEGGAGGSSSAAAAPRFGGVGASLSSASDSAALRSPSESESVELPLVRVVISLWSASADYKPSPELGVCPVRTGERRRARIRPGLELVPVDRLHRRLHHRVLVCATPVRKVHAPELAQRHGLHSKDLVLD
eukprot:CAMPEP_0182563142 /NCGR_PEP_ID=MMETSP1324-20130603/5346_1 /TAXON_ID=236786 /ORGANISM="Florenciella sp., Strain RCC1587" /LENGTH=157 /DNA_ID=CAMNT_0024776261 /DNA_START=172 /DNA_END=644 /DNA_ORIENTATION=-